MFSHKCGFAGLMLAVVLSACGGSSGGITPPGIKKPDPFVTIQVHNLLDTTTAVGRTQWHMYALITAPDVRLNGVANQGTLSLQDRRTNHSLACIRLAADSVGQRFVSLVAFGDTTTSELTADADADALVTAWQAGNHTLPAGWDVLVVNPQDAWQSEQYNAGHGLVPSDPIRWAWDWTAGGATSFYERQPNDDAYCNTFYGA